MQLNFKTKSKNISLPNSETGSYCFLIIFWGGHAEYDINWST